MKLLTQQNSVLAFSRQYRAIIGTSAERLKNQAVAIAAAMISYGIIGPALQEVITGQSRWMNLNQILGTTFVMVISSFMAVYGTTPLGWIFQKTNLLGKKHGKAKTIGIETLSTVAVLQWVGLVHGWNPGATLVTGLASGLTQSLPLSVNSKRWGNQPTFAARMRAGVRIFIHSINAAISAIASQTSNKYWYFLFGAIVIAFNYGLASFLSRVPMGKSGKNSDIF